MDALRELLLTENAKTVEALINLPVELFIRTLDENDFFRDIQGQLEAVNPQFVKLLRKIERRGKIITFYVMAAYHCLMVAVVTLAVFGIDALIN